MLEIIPSFQLTRELLQFWKIPRLQFLAQYKEGSNGRGFFHRIRKPNGESCRLPDEKAIQVFAIEGNYHEGFDYEISLFVAPDAKRKELGNNYLLFLDTRNTPPKQVRFSPKAHIEKIANEYSSPIGIARETLRELVGKLVVETNKREETFIYELLQNADDYPDPKTGRVDISFEIYDKYLIVRHNGLPFLPNNVYALCSVGAGEKVNDKNKTGFKGIGFKSVFQNANFVWVLSGGYSFRFDEKYHQSRGEEIFWQVIPIWTEFEEMDPNLKAINISSAPVNFMIRPKAGANPLGKYEASFKKAFQDERVLLFLRSVESLTFKKGEFTFTKSKSSGDWVLSDLPEIEVPEEIQQKVNQQIGPNSDGRVPEKYKDLISTKISFATTLSNGKVEVTPNAKIYAYLPTDQNFGFSFLLNGDFIPDGSREKLFWDLELNKYLFEEAGYQFILWLKELWEKFKDGSCNLIIPDLHRLISESTDEEKTNYLRLFEKGLAKGIAEISFIPDQNGNLKLLSELLVDQTDVSELLGVKLFQQLAEIDFPIMHPAYAQNSIVLGWMKDLELGTVYGNENFLELAHKEEFQNWLTTPENNLAFLKQFRFHDILDSPVVLDAETNLNARDKIFHSFSEDTELLNWIGAPCFHPTISDFFKAGDLGELEYTPLSFAENFIIPKKSEIDAKLDEIENCKKFYLYIYKHQKTFPDNLFEKEKLSYFKFLDALGIVRNSFHTQGQSVYFSEDSVTELVIKEVVPADKFVLLSPETYGMETSQSIDFWKKFQVKEAGFQNWVPFLKTEILNQSNTLRSLAEKQFADTGKVNSVLWLFLNGLKSKIPKEEWDSILPDFGALPVLNLDGEAISLNEAYLSHAYTGNQALESLSGRFEDLEVDFISEAYTLEKSLSSSQWGKLFRDLGAKTDEKNLIRDYVVPILNTLEEADLVQVTQLLFKHKIDSGLHDLKIKTKGGQFLPIGETVIGPPYYMADFWEMTLSGFSLENEIHPDYLTGNQTEAWAEYFKAIGASAIVSSEQLIQAKIDKAISKSWVVSEESDKDTIALIHDLLNLESLNSLTEKHFETLRSLPVLVNTESDRRQFRIVSEVWLGSTYKPKIDLEALLQKVDVTDDFISSCYVKENMSPHALRKLFCKMGAFEEFEIIEEDIISRAEADQEYVSFIDSLNSSIKSNYSTYPQYRIQHKIHAWKDIPYKEHLFHPEVAFLFWTQFQRDSFFRRKIGESSTYHWHGFDYKITGPNCALWWVIYHPSVPILGGDHCAIPSQLYSIRFKDLLPDSSKISGIDFPDFKIGDVPPETFFGIEAELNLELVFSGIHFLKDYNKLKSLGVWAKLKTIIAGNRYSGEDLDRLNLFKVNGFLPNQRGEFKPLNQLFLVDPEFDLGIGSNIHLVHNELIEIAPSLGIRMLIESDFNPVFPDQREDIEFKDRLFNHLILIAFAEDEHGFEELHTTFQTRVSELNFYSASSIILSFNDVQQPIQNTEKTLYIQDNSVIYIGRWNGPWAESLFKFLCDKLELKRVSFKFLGDLLMNEPSATIGKFQNGGNNVPEIITEHFTQVSEDKFHESPIEYGRAVEEEKNNVKLVESFGELEELERLLGRGLDPNSKENTNLIALFRCIKFYQSQDYIVSTQPSEIDEALEKRFLTIKSTDGQTLNVMFRSAKGNILYLSFSAWFELNSQDTKLFVVTGNGEANYKTFPSQEDLAAQSEDAWVMKVGGENKLSDLKRLIQGEYAIEGNQFDAQIQFLIRFGTESYQSIFEKLPPIGSEW
jgi:hypothetical protein